MIKILAFGWWQNSNNIGDRAIFEGIKKIFQKCEILMLPKLKLKSIKGLYAFYKIIRSVDLVLVTGGTPLYDYNHFYRFLLIILPKILSKPVVFFGVGVKPIDSRIGKFLIKYLVNKADMISVRDPLSKKLLKKLGVKKEIKVTGDSAIMLTPKNFSFPYNDFTIIVPRCLSSNYKKHFHQKLNKYEINKIKKWLKSKILFTKNKIIYIPFNSNHYDDDMPWINEFNKICPSIIIKNNISVQEMLFIFSKAKNVIGLRLHSLIFAFMQNVPFETYSYDIKIDGFLELSKTKEINKIKKDILEEKEKILSLLKKN